mmetsp:Transcript_40810/g.115511  ORF Transcript_40810/g.115511 Transcript_40810/m.115511 type:complete len:219 (+) Transcript_40810:1325-1981(+)
MDVPVEASGWAVVPPVLARQPREHLDGVPERRGGAPHELGLPPLRAERQVLVVDAPEEEPREADLGGEERRMRRGVPEGVDLPADPRRHPELLHQELVAQRRLVDHVQVERRGLVVHAPTSVDHFELTGLDQPPGEVAHGGALLVPPPLEEGLLRVREGPVRVLAQGAHHGVEDHPYARVLDGVVLPREILIKGLEPAHVVMRVRHDVHANLGRAGPR